MAVYDSLKEMTIGDLLKNPTGKGSAQMAARKYIIQDLDIRYGRLLLKHNNHLNVKCFKSKDDYLIYVAVPAEKYDGLHYDVLLQFTPNVPSKEDEDSIKGDRTLNRYRLKLFSNSPNFMFTYTYVLNKNEMIVRAMKHKCSNLALTQTPSIRNPVESYGFEKSCYFACKYLSDMGYLNKDLLDQNLTIYDSLALNSLVKSQEAKLKEYELFKKQLKKSNRNTKAVSTKKPANKQTKSKSTNKSKKK